MAGCLHFIEAVSLYTTSLKEARGHWKDAQPVTFKTGLLKKNLQKEKRLLADKPKRDQNAVWHNSHTFTVYHLKSILQTFFWDDKCRWMYQVNIMVPPLSHRWDACWTSGVSCCSSVCPGFLVRQAGVSWSINWVILVSVFYITCHHPFEMKGKYLNWKSPLTCMMNATNWSSANQVIVKMISAEAAALLSCVVLFLFGIDGAITADWINIYRIIFFHLLASSSSQRLKSNRRCSACWLCRHFCG